MIINNSFFVLFCHPKYIKSLTLVTYNFKIFRAIIPQTFLGWLTTTDLPLIYTACYVLLKTCGNFCYERWWDIKIQINKRHGSWRPHCTIRTSLLEWNSTFIGPLKALNIHIERWVCVQRIGEGKKQEIYWSRFMRGMTFKRGSDKCYCLKPKILQPPPPPTQAVKNDQSLVYWETGHLTFLNCHNVILQRCNFGDNGLDNFRDKG